MASIDISRLKANLLNSKLNSTNPALFQVISQLIDKCIELQQEVDKLNGLFNQ